MALEDLVSQQQDEPVSPADSTENVVDESQQTASDAAVDNINAPGEQEVDVYKEKTQKRFEEILADRKAANERAAAMESELQELRSKLDDSQPKTLNDLDSTALENFIAMNEESEDDQMLAHVKEARSLVVDKKVEEKLAAQRESLEGQKNAQRMSDLSNQLASIVGGSEAGDQSSELYGYADQKYRILQSEFGEDAIKNNPLAPALAFALAKTEIPAPSTLKTKVLNRSDRIESSNRTPAATDGSLEAYLKDNKGVLTKSTLTQKGTANGAIRKLGMFQE